MPARFADTRSAIGQAKEALAGQFLQAQGLVLVQRNYRCRAGEVDLIMRERDLVVFVEVRFRRSNTHGSPGETLTLTKQQRIIRAAAQYLQRFAVPPPCRFDLVAIGANDRIDWVSDAFRPES